MEEKQTKGTLCPMNNFSPCREKDCVLWMRMMLNSDPPQEKFGCSMNWTPILLTELSQKLTILERAVKSGKT